MCGVDDDVVRDLGLGGEDSPWAHDVPASPAPPLPDAWTRVEPPRDPSPTIDAGWARGAAPDSAPDTAPDPTTTTGIGVDAPPAVDEDTDRIAPAPGHRRRPAMIVGAIALVGLAAVGTSMVLGGSDE